MADPKYILIVEDEKPLSHALELKLKNEGYEIVVATNGQEALDAIKSKQFDVMLLDLMMPTMDGFQVLQQIQSDEQKPKAIFVLSNLSQQEDEERVLALGAKKFFIKSDTSLSTIVEEVKVA
jgi:two-component system, OmpR family, response regulator VanR